jgi:hypothetical protein
MKQRTIRIQDLIMGHHNLITVDRTTFHTIAIITDEAYAEFEKCSNAIVKFDRANIVREYVHTSADILETRISAALMPMNRQLSDNESLAILHDLDLKLINFVASVSLAYDHTKTRLSRTYGKDSKMLRDYLSIDSVEYDVSFNYRFMKRLRNFAVHCEQPISHFVLNGKLNNPPFGNAATYQFEIGFDRMALIRDFDGWSTLKKEIESGTEYIPLSGIIADTKTSVDRIFEALRVLELPIIHEYSKFVMELIEPALYRNSSVGISSFMDLGSGNITASHKDAPLLILEKLGYDIRGTNDDIIVDNRLRDRPPGPVFR